MRPRECEGRRSMIERRAPEACLRVARGAVLSGERSAVHVLVTAGTCGAWRFYAQRRLCVTGDALDLGVQSPQRKTRPAVIQLLRAP